MDLFSSLFRCLLFTSLGWCCRCRCWSLSTTVGVFIFFLEPASILSIASGACTSPSRRKENFFNSFTKMTVSLFARSIARRGVQSALRGSNKIAPQVGAVRFSSYYTPAHEYVTVDGKTGTVGITDFAQSALGDIVFVDLPAVGEEFEKGDSFGSVESVKAASDVYAPVTGTVVEINDALTDEPGLVNSNAEDDAWFIKLEISDDSELGDLMDANAYKEHCEKEAH